MSTPLHIGIVGCSAEGAALCYRTICSQAAALLGPHTHPEISMHTPSLDLYVNALEQKDLTSIGKLMLDSARKLAATGADFLICPDNTIHQAFPYVESRSPLPWLHIAEVVAITASESQYKRVGLTGTRWLVDSPVYPEKLKKLGIECMKPTIAERDEMNRIIMEELVYGQLTPESISYFLSIIQNFKKQDCEAVILGCTEIPLIVNDENSVLPTLDSTRLLARAALQRSIKTEVT